MFIKSKYCKYAVITTIALCVLSVINLCTHTFPLNLFADKVKSHADAIKLLSWNVKCSAEDFSSNQNEIVKCILVENPDIVFLCEIALSRAPILDSIMSSCYSRNYISGTNAVVFSKYSTGIIQEVRYEGLVRKHSLIVMVDVYIGNDTLRVVGCHLSSGRKKPFEARKLRSKEVDAILSVVDTCSHPVVILGDMNDVAGSRTLTKLENNGMKNAWWEKGRGYGSTFHGYGLRLRIDHVMYDAKNLMLSEVTVGETDLSDHDYMTATFSIR